MSINTYAFQCKINTLASCVGKSDHSYNFFEFEGIKFTHSEFNFAEGWKPGGWIVTGETQVDTFYKARIALWEKLNDLVPKIAMISQCYTEYLQEPFIIHRLDTDIALFYYSKATSGVPLHFDEESQQALALLAKNLPNEFYYYWNDMLNSTGYPAKLLLICSALETLGKALGKDKGAFRKEVLGDVLSKKVFEKDNQGIRHRLTHGEYFLPKDAGEDYLAQIYEKIIQYFNDVILKKHLIRNVVNPQRHPWGNKEIYCNYYRKKPDDSFDLKEMIQVFDEDMNGFLARFELLTPDESKNL